MRTRPDSVGAASLLPLALAATLAGCAQGGGGDRTPDAGRPSFDAGPRADAGGELDAGSIGLPDTGPSSGSDAGAVDSGAADTGPIGAEDSGAVDAGPVDAGTPDTGPPAVDAGTDAGPPACSESPCRLVAPQCGCGAGQGCYVDGAGTRSCQPAGAAAEGAACAADNDCQVGLLCLQNGAGGFCARFCDSDAMCTAGPGSLCVVELSATTDTLCSTECDPGFYDCPAGMACEIYGDGAGRAFTLCREAGFGWQHDPCFAPEDCDEGYVCANIGFGPECVYYCAYPSSAGCDFGESCNRFGSGGPVIGGTEYGYCH